MISIQGFALYGKLAASTRYRLEQYIPGLRKDGIDLKVNYLLDDYYLERRFKQHRISLFGLLKSGLVRMAELAKHHRYDAAIVHCELFPLVPGWLETSLLYKPYVYDFDDAFYLRYATERMGVLKPVLGAKFDKVFAQAAAITAGNDELARHARQFNAATELIPTVVDTVRYTPKADYRTSTFTVGWIGSPSTAPYLNSIINPLMRLAEEGRVRMVVIGGIAPAIPGVEIVELPWAECTEVELINSFDVGIMPLPDTDWAKGKCGFKLIQYMACGIPVIATAVGANRTLVSSDCGYLVCTDEDWIHALRVLRDNQSIRQTMGEAGRCRVDDHYSLKSTLPKMAATLRRVAGK
jgi:glycosyltransferase involved in cell wall biosynthesis